MSPSLSSRLGPSPHLHLLQEGSFSHEAALLLQQQIPDLVLEFHQRIIDAWSRLGQGHAVLLPVENAGSGPVKQHLELLRQADDRRVAGEVRLCVDMRAGGKAGTDLRSVTHVHSHRQALLQCNQFLQNRDRLPALEECVAEDSTAQALQRVTNLSHIALGTRSAIEMHGLVDLQGESVANLPPQQNVTQFLVVVPNGETHAVQPERRYHALFLRPEKDVPGVLATILGIIKSMRVNLQSFHSLRSNGGRRAFYMETDGSTSTPGEVRCMAQSLANSAAVASLDWVGSWDDIAFSPEYQSAAASDGEGPPAVLGQDRLDCSLRYHSFRFRTHDKPGVLCDVLQPLSPMGVNLLELDSVTRGEKQYDFMATVDAGKGERGRFEAIAGLLHHHPALQEIEWMHSRSVPPVLGRYSVSDPWFVGQVTSRFMEHLVRADESLPPGLVSALQLPESGQNAIGMKDALLADPDLYRRQEILAEMVLASSEASEPQLAAEIPA